MFANYDLQKSEFRKYKVALVNKYRTKYNKAKLKNSSVQIRLNKNTLLCIIKAQSRWELNDCKVVERRYIMQLIQQKRTGQSVNSQSVNIQLITPYKKNLVSKYYSLVEKAKTEKKKAIYRNTILCIQSSHNLKKIESCAKYSKSRVKSLVKDKPFVVKQDSMIKEFKTKYNNSNSENRKYFISQTISCIKDSTQTEDLSNCKKNDSKYVKSIIKSFKDNPKLSNLNNASDLINRYKIRIEEAKIDKETDKVSILSKTLSCFENTHKNIDSCKKDEKQRILSLLKF